MPLTDLDAVRRVTTRDPEAVLIGALNGGCMYVCFVCVSEEARALPWHARELAGGCACLSACLLAVCPDHLPLVDLPPVWGASVLGAETFHADVHAGNLLVSTGRLHDSHQCCTRQCTLPKKGTHTLLAGQLAGLQRFQTSTETVLLNKLRCCPTGASASLILVSWAASVRRPGGGSRRCCWRRQHRTMTQWWV